MAEGATFVETALSSDAPAGPGQPVNLLTVRIIIEAWGSSPEKCSHTSN